MRLELTVWQLYSVLNTYMDGFYDHCHFTRVVPNKFTSMTHAYCFQVYAYVYIGTCGERYLSSCYIFVNEQQTWESARIRCHSMGGHLATIDSQAESNVVHRMVNSKFYMQI